MLHIFRHIKKVLPLLGVFLCIFLVFFGIDMLIPGFIGSDAYYHLKHALLIGETQTWGYVAGWIPYHFLGNISVDPYLLHHTVLAVWLTYFSDPIVATKLFAALLSVSVYAAYYIALKGLRVPAPLLLTVLFFLSSPIFIYRLLLDRPFTVSIIASILAVLLILKKRHVTLFLLSVVTILSYNLAVLLVPTVVVYMLVVFWQTKRIELKPFIAVLGGILIGLLIHPDTINYIHLIFIHLFQVFALKFAGVSLPVGAEIVPAKLLFTFAAHFWTFLFSIMATAVTYVLYVDKKLGQWKTPVLFLCAMQFLWLPVVLFVPRGSEYWVPFAWLFIASLLAAVQNVYPFEHIRFIQQKKYWLLGILLFGMFNSTTSLIIQQLPNTTVLLETRASDKELTTALSTEPSTVLFYPFWPLFTELFYDLGESHQYVAGFDPTHTYTYNQDLYYAWFRISSFGEYCLTDNCEESRVPLRTAIPTLFDSNIIIIPNQEWYVRLQEAVEAESIPRMFENDAYTVYRID